MDEEFKKIAFTRDWYRVKFLPDLEQESGVYLLVFRNKKRYIGSSCNLFRRIKEHLNSLLFSSSSSSSKKRKWYAAARRENNFPTDIPYWELQKHIDIFYCSCEDYGEFEDQLLKSIEGKDYWYNSQFTGNNKR